MLIRRPKLLILDEATSALDPLSEQAVLDTILDLKTRRGVTTISVSHHTVTAVDADIILVLDGKGQLSQSGTYDELSQQDGVFKELLTATATGEQ